MPTMSEQHSKKKRQMSTARIATLRTQMQYPPTPFQIREAPPFPVKPTAHLPIASSLRESRSESNPACLPQMRKKPSLHLTLDRRYPLESTTRTYTKQTPLMQENNCYSRPQIRLCLSPQSLILGTITGFLQHPFTASERACFFVHVCDHEKKRAGQEGKTARAKTLNELWIICLSLSVYHQRKPLQGLQNRPDQLGIIGLRSA